MTGHRFSGWIVPLLAALVASFSAPAAAERWEPLSLWGGEVQVAAANGDSRVLYAASPSAGLYRSVDGGASWQLRSLGPQRGRIQILGVDPHDTSRLYILTNDASGSSEDLYRSDDGGLHWRKSNAGLRRFVFNLAFDPKTPGRLYAATDAGLYRSDDRGKSWARIAFARQRVRQVSVAPRDPRVVLAAVDTETDDFGSTWRSADGGATFTEVLDRAVQEHAFDPSHPGRLYGLDSYRHLQRSDDLGATWTDLTGSPFTLHALTVTPAGTLLAGSIDSGVMRSVDGGLTWRFPDAPADVVSSLVVGKDGDVLAGGRRGVWKSLSDGQGWRAASTGILGQWILSLEAGTDSSVWASVGGGFFTSPDVGERFQSRTGALDGVGFLQHLAIHPLQPQVAYAYGCCVDESSGLFKTEDGGRTWELLPYTGSQHDVAVVAVDPVDPDVVYVGGFFHPKDPRCPAVRSTDGGATWSCMGTLTYPYRSLTDLVIDLRDPRILHGLFSGVLQRSADRGQTWKKVSARAQALDHLTVDPARQDRLFALSRIGPGIWRSEDGGRRWTLLAAGLPKVGFVSDLLLDPSRPDRIWIAVEVFALFGQVERSATRIFRSDDAGTHWTEVSDGLTPGVVVLRLAADPERADVLYAGTAGQGVYRLVVVD